MFFFVSPSWCFCFMQKKSMKHLGILVGGPSSDLVGAEGYLKSRNHNGKLRSHNGKLRS